MAENDLSLGFSRSSRFRQSLPLSRSASQSKLRSPGVLFLQFGDETRRVHITHELTSMETLHALIVHMFPQKLTAGMLKSPNTAILIKDEARNVFYELEDVRDIQDRSIIKIYRKEPIYASYPASHLANGDLRRDMVYSSRESSPTRRLNTLPSSSANSSPARSRLSYSGTTGRPPSFPPHPHGAHHSHGGGGSHHGSSHHGSPGGSSGPGGLSHSSSAILERRDVKPDEELSAKSLVLLKNEGLYADPYSLMHEGRLSIASTQSLAALAGSGPGPVSLPDPLGPPGLYRRGSVRSLSTYSAAGLQGDMDDPLYRPGASIYTDTYATLGFRLPPPSSPQKLSDGPAVRDRDVFSSPPSRASPVRQSFRKDSSSSVFVESPKSRPSSSSDPLSLHGNSSPLPGNERDTRRDRMEAMEKQIASLTGLVQSVLTRGPDSDSTCGLLRLCMMAGCPPDQGADFSRPFPFSSSEKTESASDGSATGNQTPSAPLALMPPPPSGGSPANSLSKLQMQLHLHDLKQNATDLRKQLSHLRKMQLQNQDSMRTLMKRTEGEITMRVCDALRKQEDPLQRQRLLVEEERLKYLNEEELIIQQLHDLEKSVDEIQKQSSTNHKMVSMQELEEKAAVLRRLGETLTELKNQFPGLQSKMRVVLRVEVEAVKFLKEEPHRLDALLKRCRTITDTLTTLRRQATEGVWKSQEDGVEDDYRKSVDFDLPTSPPLSINDSLSNWSPHSSHGHTHNHSHSHSHSHGHNQRSREEQGGRLGPDKSMSVEVRLAAERDWEEKRASLTQYSAQDINRLLEETQAELMKAIPDLDFAAKHMRQPGQNQNQTQTQPQPQQQAQPQQPPSGQATSNGAGGGGGGGVGSTNATPEHRPKPQHKLSRDGSSRRGSDELTVARYRTEKHSKSPPPPPPRRSFPSSPGPTTRSGEPIMPEKGLKKSESEDSDMPKPMVKLRKSLSEVPRPASTPPNTGAPRDGLDDHTNNTDMEVPSIVLTPCHQEAPSSSQDSQSAPAPQYHVTGSPRLKRGPHRHSVTGAETLSWRKSLLATDGSPQGSLGPGSALNQLQGVGSSGSLPNRRGSLDGQHSKTGGFPGELGTRLGAGALARGDDIRATTYRRLDSLEETIRELESTLMEIGGHPSAGVLPNPSSPLAQGPSGSSEPGHPNPRTKPQPQTPGEPAGTGGPKRPPVPPKPSIRPPYTQGGNSTISGGGKILHSSSSAASRLKHLQQGTPEKSKLSRQREDFLKSQGQLQQ